MKRVSMLAQNRAMEIANSAHRALIAWALNHGGVFTRAVAASHGMTAHQFRTGRSRGLWQRYRGVWQLAGSVDSQDARIWAGLMRAGTGAVVTGPTALSLHGLDTDFDTYRKTAHHPKNIYLSAPTNSHMRIPGIVTLRETGIRVVSETVELRGVPLSTRERAVIDTIRVLGWHPAKVAVFRCVQVGWITPATIGDSVAMFRGCRGAVSLTQAAVALSTGAHSEAERLTHRILRNAGLGDFAANHAVFDDRGLIGYVDIAFVDSRVAVEIDGLAWHSDSTRFQRDRSRQNRLANAGWEVRRFTWDDITNRPAQMIETIREAIRRSRSG